MNLMISETLPSDTVLERAVPWIDDLDSYLSTVLLEDDGLEPREHRERAWSGRESGWCELNLSMLRHLFADAY
jgi:hypothetical protein